MEIQVCPQKATGLKLMTHLHRGNMQPFTVITVDLTFVTETQAHNVLNEETRHKTARPVSPAFEKHLARNSGREGPVASRIYI